MKHLLVHPGSLYTSVIPNLLVDGIAEAICASAALKIYVCNIMTQEGETEGYTAADHVAALLKHGGPGLVEFCLCNNAPVSEELLKRYEAEGAEPIKIDKDEVKVLGAEVVLGDLASDNSQFARHDYMKLADALIKLYEERANTRIF